MAFAGARGSSSYQKDRIENTLRITSFYFLLCRQGNRPTGGGGWGKVGSEGPQGHMKTDPSQGVGLTSVLLSKLAVEKKWHMVVDCELTYVVLA